MKEDLRYVVGGAAVGAMIGALIGWLYMRSHAQQPSSISSGAQSRALDTRQLMRLGGAVVGVIRQIIELG